MQTRYLPTFLSQERSNLATRRRRAPSQRFPGDPGEGRYYMGWSVSTSNLTDENGNPLSYIDTVNNYLQRNPGVFHDYNASGCVSSSRYDTAIGYGGLASLTFKLDAFTHTQITAGSADATLTSSVNICKARAPWPAWLCFHHEPEDFVQDVGLAADYRAAYRYIVQFFRDAGVTNVAWCCILSAPFVFTDREWYRIHPDWKGTGPGSADDWHRGPDKMMDFFGFDTYNAGIGSTTYRTWVADVQTPIEDGMADDGFTAAYGKVPWGIFETGMSANTSPYTDWTTAWAPDMRRWALNNAVCICYWNSNTTGPPADTPRYDFKAASDALYPSKLNALRMISAAASNFDTPG